jgi:hypothetical protein
METKHTTQETNMPEKAPSGAIAPGKTVSFYASNETIEAAKKLAAADNRSLSQWISLLITREVEAHTPQETK